MEGGADRDGSMALLLGQVWAEDGDDQRMIRNGGQSHHDS